MKWIVVILVLLNLSVWLFGKRIDPDVKQSLRADQVEIVNAAGMTVVEPAEEMAMRKKNEELALEEEKIMQLKLDERGTVLMTPSAAKKENEMPTPKSVVETPKPVKIVALDRSESDSSPAPTPDPVPEAKEAVVSAPTPPPATEPEPEPVPEKPKQLVLKCYRIGPFVDQSNFADVRRALNRNSMRYSVDERGAAKKVKAVLIYLGNFANAAEMQAETERLKKMGIDHYVVKLDDKSVIQLGYFSEPARGPAFQKTLKSRGVNARAYTLYHEAKKDSWFDVQQASMESIAKLALPNGVLAKEQACR